MKKALRIFPVFSLLIFAGACILPVQAARETRDLKPFTGIGIGISADVYYTPGNAHEIIIEGDEADVKDLISSVDNGFLKLKYDDWKTRRSKLTIYVTSPELEKVSVSGSAKFEAEEKISSEEMEISISGSGSVLFAELNSEELEVQISGSGNAVLKNGKAEELALQISGSGKVLAEHFEVSECTAAVSGSGSCKISVKDELEARISGSGSIYYHGDPQVNSRSSGSGKVRTL